MCGHIILFIEASFKAVSQIINYKPLELWNFDARRWGRESNKLLERDFKFFGMMGCSFYRFFVHFYSDTNYKTQGQYTRGYRQYIYTGISKRKQSLKLNVSYWCFLLSVSVAPCKSLSLSCCCRAEAAGSMIISSMKFFSQLFKQKQWGCLTFQLISLA